MKVKFITYDSDYLKYKKEYDAAWETVNTRGDLILRRNVQEFEENLAHYVGTSFAVGVHSGTDALYLSLKALGISGRVALPSHTFKATCGAVINAGATPVLYDMDGVREYTLADAHIPVHIAGELSPVIDEGIPIIEDACQAFGAIKDPWSDAQCWSFYPAKIMGGKGDGGAVTTNREDVYEYVKEARNHFKTDNRDFGGNYRLDNLQSALLNIKLRYIDEILGRRKEVAEEYLDNIQGVGLPNNQKGRVWQDFIIRTTQRDALHAYLKNKGIETMKNEYPFSPQYPKLPLAAKYEAETVKIPCHEHLTDFEVEYIIKTINDFS